MYPDKFECEMCEDGKKFPHIFTPAGYQITKLNYCPNCGRRRNEKCVCERNGGLVYYVPILNGALDKFPESKFCPECGQQISS